MRMNIKVISSGNKVSNPQVGPNKVTRIAPMQSYVMEYTDERGKVRTGIIHEIGGSFFMNPTDEMWVKNLKMVNKCIVDGASPRVEKAKKGELKKVLTTIGMEVPEDTTLSDKVDVISKDEEKDKTAK